MERLLKNLLIDYMNSVAGVLATMIIDRLDYTDPMVCLGDKSFTDLIYKFLDDNFKRIKSEFGIDDSFLEIISIDNQKYAICSLGKSMIITIAKEKTTDIELKVYSVHLADKIQSILNGEQEVSLKIPGIIRLYSKSTKGMIPEGNFSLKIIIVGNRGSGKSSLVHNFVYEEFRSDLDLTVGFDILKKKINVSESSRINYILWDTGGFSSEISPTKEKIYNFADAAIIVIDRTRSDNIKSIKRWINKINESVLYKIPIIIIGTKIDLGADPKINENDLKKLVKEFGTHYISTSAKTGYNIKNAFIEITCTVLNNAKSGDVYANPSMVEMNDIKRSSESRGFSTVDLAIKNDTFNEDSKLLNIILRYSYLHDKWICLDITTGGAGEYLARDLKNFPQNEVFRKVTGMIIK